MSAEREADQARLYDCVCNAVSAVLGMSAAAVRASDTLLDLPGFDSVAIVAVLDRLEAALGVEVPPELIVAESFESVQALADLFQRSLDGSLSRPDGPPDMAITLLHDLLDQRAVTSPRAIGLVRDSASWTYQQLSEMSRAAARTLRGLGLARGERVVLIGHNEALLVPLLFAVSRVGAAFVLLSDEVRPYHLRHILADCAPRLVIGNGRAVMLSRELTGVPVLHLDEFATLVDGAAVTEGGEVMSSPCLSIDPACLIYTSGSTAMPKAVVSTHRHMLFAIEAIGDQLGYRDDDTVFCCLPLSFDYGLYQIFLSCAAGARLVLGDDSDAGPALLGRLIDRDVTVLPLVPTMAVTLCRLVQRTGRVPRRLRMVTNTGAALTPTRSENLRAAVPGLAVVAMFGLTECKRVSIAEPNLDLLRPGSVGRPLPDTEVFIVDDDGRPLPCGEVGELVVRGPHVMAGYWNAPELTASRYRRDTLGQTLLYTGDLCLLDADGYLYFVGRGDDIFKQRGVRVSTLEIEAAALDIAGVELAAALVPDGPRGSRLAVTGDITHERLVQQLLARLGESKLPSECRVVDEFPVSLNGKIDKRALAQRWETPTVPVTTHAKAPA